VWSYPDPDEEEGGGGGNGSGNNENGNDAEAGGGAEEEEDATLALTLNDRVRFRVRSLEFTQVGGHGEGSVVRSLSVKGRRNKERARGAGRYCCGSRRASVWVYRSDGIPLLCRPAFLRRVFLSFGFGSPAQGGVAS